MTSFVDVVRPSHKSLAITFDCLAVIAGSLFIALMAQLSFPLGFTPVPLTFHTLAILLIGGLLGSKRGALAVLAYFAEGSIGLPVFANGSSGIACFAGPSGGYLLGFVICAFVVGYLLERGWKEKYILTFIAMTFGSLIILVVGATWLSLFVGSENALSMGIYPFLIGDALKTATAAALIPSGWKIIQLIKTRLAP